MYEEQTEQHFLLVKRESGRGGGGNLANERNNKINAETTTTTLVGSSSSDNHATKAQTKVQKETTTTTEKNPDTNVTSKIVPKLLNHTRNKEELSSQRSNKNIVAFIKKMPLLRESCSVIEVLPDGTIRTMKEASKSQSHPEVLDQLQVRLYDAVAEYGMFDSAEQYYFDIDSIDVPSCQRTIPFSCKELYNKCCVQHLRLLGVATNPCCPCVLPLPIHENQKQSVLDEILLQNNATSDPYDWNQKLNKAVWHGNPSGHPQHALLFSRVSHFEMMTRTPRQTIVAMANSTRFNANGTLEASFERKDWSTDILRYKYIVSVSGNSYAGLLKPALLSNSCVLRQDSIAREWYEDLMIEWVHYVPVRYDLMDLMDKIDWAMKHDKECQDIAQRGREFALQHFTASATNKFVHDTILKNPYGHVPL